MVKLSKESYFQWTGLIFLVVGVAHGLRAFNEWTLTFNTWDVPVWVSWIVAVVALWFAYSAKKFM